MTSANASGMTKGTIGAALRKARLAGDLTQTQLAELVGRDQSAVSAWEADRCLPSPDCWPALLRILRVHVGDLLTRGSAKSSHG